jgi:hypothetical protein
MRPGILTIVVASSSIIVALLCLDHCRESSSGPAPSAEVPARETPPPDPPPRFGKDATWSRRLPPEPVPDPRTSEPLGARLARLLDEDSQGPRLVSHQLADFVASRGSNAFSLVAAFEATLDPEFL